MKELLDFITLHAHGLRDLATVVLIMGFFGFMAWVNR